MSIPPQTEYITVSDEELKSLTDAISLRHGIDFSCYEPKSLKRRVVRALHVFRLNAVHELWIKILQDRTFIYPFMDEISVGLTSMFRDPILWQKLRELLVSKYLERKELTLWHAGCSTGEEVFTMGIVLGESAYFGNVSGFATDISNQAIATARMGIYNGLKMSDYEANYRQYNPGGNFSRYYKALEKDVQMDTDLIRHVKFEHHNLITSPFTRKFDIIFCRNVMIYFDSEAKIKLFDKFYQSLNPNGLLIIGFYDAVIPLIDQEKFRVVDMDAKIFQKVQQGQVSCL